MKTLARIVFIAAGVAVAVPATNAADPAAPTSGAGTGEKHPRLHALMQRKAVRERIAQRLGLTAGQTAQLKAIRDQAATTVKSLRADATLTRDQKKAQAREALQAARTAARGVLTADQTKQLNHLRQHLRARRHGKA